MLFFPLIQLTCFYLAIGKTPTNLKLGIVTGEVNDYATCFDQNLRTVFNHNDTCEFEKISCRYIIELGDGIAERVCICPYFLLNFKLKLKQLANYENIILK